MIGRKGSGKSTITRYITEKKKPFYKGCINLKADDFNMETIFSYFNAEQINADTRETLSRLKTFKYAWELFFYLRAIQIIVIEYDCGRLSSEQMKYISPLKEIIEKITSTTRHVRIEHRDEQFFIYSLQKVHSFVNYCINTARCDNDTFLSDLVGKYQFTELLDWAIGCDAIYSLKKIIEDCRRRILITLDNFDEMHDEYRKRTTIYYKDKKISERTIFESLWLRSLLSVIIEIKEIPKSYIATDLYNLFDFCIAIPKDRFIEIQKLERDSYIYEGKYMQMNWSGIELSILLRKRLDLLGDITTQKNNLPIDRLKDSLKKNFPKLPKNISLKAGNANLSMPLFLYVLRFTFWRPRAVLMYYAHLFALSEQMDRRNLPISDFSIKRIITQTSFKVVQQEFINEFKNILFNIRDILKVFKQSNQLLSFEELEEKLGSIEFNFSYLADPLNDFRKKVIFLYETGFLGFNVGEETRDRYHLMFKHAFYFNEGDSLIRGLNDLNHEDTSFIIHPMFRDYLRLKLNGNGLILNYTWDYIRENEAFFHSIE